MSDDMRMITGETANDASRPQVDGVARGEAIRLILGEMTKGIGRQTTVGGYDSYQQMAAVAAVQLDKTLVTLLAARRRRATERMTAGGLAPLEESVLRFLLERGATTATKLARLLGVKRPTVTVTVRRLHRYGLGRVTTTPQIDGWLSSSRR